MGKVIDCFFVGNNLMGFDEQEKMSRNAGLKSAAYREMDLTFIQHNGRALNGQDVYNMFRGEDNSGQGPLSIGNIFSGAIAYLGTFVHRRGLSFDFILSFSDDWKEFAKKLRENDVLTVCIITTFYMSPLPIQQIVSFVRRYTDAKIIVGGPFILNQVKAAQREELSLERMLDTINADIYVNSSQGEMALVNVVNALKNKQPLEGICNIIYREGGIYKATPVSPERNNLAENMVDWSLFEGRTSKHVLTRTSISCPFSCKFCSFPIIAGKYATVGVLDIERELDSIAKLGTVESVTFIDDTLNIPPERFKEVLRMMIRKRYPFKWHSFFRCQFADREMMELMRESNCEGVFLGIESGCQKILDNMNKATTTEKYKAGIALLKEYDILHHASVIIGFPGETEDTALETIRFIEDMELDTFKLEIFFCNTDTPIWQEREKYNLRGAQLDWSHATMDATRTIEIIEEAFLSIKKSIWLPQISSFGYWSIYQLLHLGMSKEQIKEFLKAFNIGVKDKVAHPAQREVSFEVLERLRKICQGGCASEDILKENQNVAIDFNF